jgi:hypothetical protein
MAKSHNAKVDKEKEIGVIDVRPIPRTVIDYQISVTNNIYYPQWDGKENKDVPYVKMKWADKEKIESINYRHKPTKQEIINDVADQILEKMRKNDMYTFALEHDGFFYSIELATQKWGGQGIVYTETTAPLKLAETLRYQIIELLHFDVLEYKSTRYQNNKNLLDIPLFGFGDDNLFECVDYMTKTNIILKNTKLCGADTIDYFIHSHNIHGLQSITSDQIRRQLLHIKEWNTSELDNQDCKEELQEYGTSANDIIKWVELHGKQKINLIAIDAFNLPIDGGSRNYGAHDTMIIKIRNSHVYIIEDESLKKEIISTGKIRRPRMINTDDIDLSNIKPVRDMRRLYQRIQNSEESVIIAAGSWVDVVQQY